MPPAASPPAPICYLEIPAPVPKESAEFYGKVFGWTASPSGLTELNYWMFQTGDGQLMGGFDSEKPVQSGGMIFYIKVTDIDLTLKAIEEAGGTICSAKEAVGGSYGFTGIFRDPAGNTIGLWSQE